MKKLVFVLGFIFFTLFSVFAEDENSYLAVSLELGLFPDRDMACSVMPIRFTGCLGYDVFEDDSLTGFHVDFNFLGRGSDEETEDDDCLAMGLSFSSLVAPVFRLGNFFSLSAGLSLGLDWWFYDMSDLFECYAGLGCNVRLTLFSDITIGVTAGYYPLDYWSLSVKSGSKRVSGSGFDDLIRVGIYIGMAF